ncbi:Alpha/beta hydrolase family protein [Frankia sp. EI5c]|uniref:alpha/beta fold hydrolase n=1 Tax=Frankia sp. EI5c TaxID=683316 RepID=UPI0007C3648C|nr:alpha/beta fold hydrolase [Frankia sp. EI5c]OAA27351.1 Alpha/beta hydrolase family protein [Frankia sp. EI5c]
MSSARRPYVALCGAFLAAVVAGAATFGCSDSSAPPTPVPTTTPAEPPVDPSHLPILFVHGGAGSGAQFETPARRFAANGYPVSHIDAIDWDSTLTVETAEQIHARIDARIDALLNATGAARVELVGHSMGTMISQDYLTSRPERAARVAHYVNLDGRTAQAPPGGVPTLAVWAEGDPARRIVGATNVQFADLGHTESVTSPRTFEAEFEFFTGRKPATTEIRPTADGKVELSGRAVLFPTNVGVSEGRLEVYEVESTTGKRRPGSPVVTTALADDGAFGPIAGRAGASYEFAILRPGGATHHFYYQPFRRSDRLIRLLTSRPGEGLGTRMETSPAHTNITISRYREWWGDQGADSDQLLVDGTNLLNAANTPREKRPIGIFLTDVGTDRGTDLTAPIPAFFSVVFMTGMDVFLPADDTAITLESVQRGTNGHRDVIAVPAFPSSEHRISILFNDYT